MRFLILLVLIAIMVQTCDAARTLRRLDQRAPAVPTAHEPTRTPV